MNYNINNNTEDLNLEDIFIIVFVLVDDFYKELVADEIKYRKNWDKKEMTDSEIITIAIVGEMFYSKGEISYYNFIKKNYSHLFPHIIERSRFNRTVRNLFEVIEQLRIKTLEELGTYNQEIFIIDSFPMPVCELSRAYYSKCFKCEASYGYCASKKMWYYGFKLHVLCTLDGIPVKYVLTSANEHDINAIFDLTEDVYGIVIFGDKGYISDSVQNEILEEKGIRLFPLKKGNMKNQYPKSFRKLIRKKRKRIETLFSQLSEQFEMERVYSKSLWGLITRIREKLLSYCICCLINKFAGKENIVKVKRVVF